MIFSVLRIRLNASTFLPVMGNSMNQRVPRCPDLINGFWEFGYFNLRFARPSSSLWRAPSRYLSLTCWHSARWVPPVSKLTDAPKLCRRLPLSCSASPLSYSSKSDFCEQLDLFNGVARSLDVGFASCSSSRLRLAKPRPAASAMLPASQLYLSTCWLWITLFLLC